VAVGRPTGPYDGDSVSEVSKLSEDAARVVVVTVADGSTELATQLSELVPERSGSVSFVDAPPIAADHRGVGEVVSAVATFASSASSVLAFLQTLLGFAASRGSDTITFTSANGASLGVPVSVSPEKLGEYLDQFERLQPVHAHVDEPAEH
jgi:hypothetical protein